MWASRRPITSGSVPVEGKPIGLVRSDSNCPQPLALRNAIGSAVLMAGAVLCACRQTDPGNLPHPAALQVGTGLDAQQVLTRSLDDPPRALDPSLTDDVPTAHILGDLFEGLVAVAIDGKPVPGVASSWEISSDGKTWVFHLRREARWSNGEPVTAQDFVYAWRRELAPHTGAAYAQALAPIANAMDIVRARKPLEALGVESPNPQTLIVHLIDPTPYFLELLDQQYFFPLYEPAITRWGEEWTHPEHMVCNGPFVLTENVLNGHVTLAKNPLYWDARDVQLQRVTYLENPDSNFHKLRFLAGDLQFAGTFPPTQYTWLKAQLADQAVTAPYLGTYMMEFNFTGAPFKGNLPLRRALTMAVDRDTLVRYMKLGLNLAAVGLVPPLDGYTQATPSWAGLSTAVRYETAQRLYHEAGYSEQHPLRIDINMPAQGADDRHFMEAIAAMWHQVLGADVGIDEREFRVLLQQESLHTLPLYQFAWIGDYPDPLTFLELFSTGSQTNRSGYSNAAFDQLLDKARQEADPSRRYEILTQAEQILNEDAASIPLFYYGSRHLIKPYVKGWQSNLIDRNPSRYMYVLQHSGH
jgi:oligopeptide transport system substrate-binding protein